MSDKLKIMQKRISDTDSANAMSESEIFALDAILFDALEQKFAENNSDSTSLKSEPAN